MAKKKHFIEASGEHQVKHNHLLAIAVNFYQDDEIDNLSNCIDDMEDLLEVLTTDYFFEKSNIRFLRSRGDLPEESMRERIAQKEKDYAVTGEANHKMIIAQLKDLAKKITPQDNLIICYSGHGIYDPDFNEGYWIPSDAELNDNSGYVENGTIRTALNAINSHHTVLISDSCYSGTLFSSGKRRAMAAVPRVYKHPSRWGLTAGRRNETVSDGKLGDNSPFAKELIRILKRKQEVWISDLCKEIVSEIENKNEAQTPMGEPFTNMDGHDGGQFVFLPRLATEKDYWIIAWRENTRNGYYAFLARYPSGEYEEAALEALNVFAAAQKPKFSEAALETYNFLSTVLPQQARDYTIGFLKGIIQSIFSKTGLEMYGELLEYSPKIAEKELKSFVLLGENASDQSQLEEDYARLKNKAEPLKTFFQRFGQQQDSNPYCGFNPYSEDQSNLFFGRKAVIQELADRLEKTGVIIISAPPYTGKTSVVRAGLYPLLKRRLGYEMLELPVGMADSSNQHHSRILPMLKADKNQLLFIDSYEDLFADGFDRRMRDEYEKFLAGLVRDKKFPKLKIVLCLRSNFEGQLRNSAFGKAFPEKESVDTCLYRLPGMNKNELREVILGPMWSRFYDYDNKFYDYDKKFKSLSETIVKEVLNMPNALALLSFAQHRLFSITDPKKRIVTHPQYEQELGRVRGALDKIADQELYEGLSPDEQRILEKIFLRMTEPLGRGNYTSRQVGISELTHPNKVENELLVALLSNKINNKKELFTIIRDEGRIAGLKPKDLLISSWTRCRQWIEGFGQENFALQRDLTRATQTGIESETYWDNDYRLSRVLGHLLAEGAKALPEEKDNQINPAIEKIELGLMGEDQTLFSRLVSQWRKNEAPITLDDFIHTGASWELMDALLNYSKHWLNTAEADFVRESWRRKVEAFMALKQERDEAITAKKEAQAFALAAKARQQYPQDNTTSLNLAMAAYRKSQNEESIAVLFDVLFSPESLFYKRFSGHDNLVFSLAFSPDGKSILTGSADKTAKLWGLDGTELRTFEGHAESVWSVAFSPDEKSILTGSEDKTAKLWDMDGKVRRTFKGHAETVIRVAFSPACPDDPVGGKSILTGSRDMTAKLWRNFFWEWEQGVIWDKIHQLTTEEQAQYKIDWPY